MTAMDASSMAQGILTEDLHSFRENEWVDRRAGRGWIGPIRAGDIRVGDVVIGCVAWATR